MSNNPIVSVIIVNLDQASLTLDCIEAIVANTEPGSYEVIVVDNGSEFVHVELLQRSTLGFKLISLKNNLFFGEANNIGVEYADCEFVAFINNDVKVTANWLNPLITALSCEFRAGAVGARMLYPNGSLQEAGAYIRPDGWTVQLGISGMALRSSYLDRTHIVDYCSAACLLMKREDFLKLSGFDPLFDPVYFEDADLALRLRSIGLFTYYCGEVSVIHEMNVTARRLWTSEQIDRIVALNHDRFVKRWGTYLRRRISEDCIPPVFASGEWRPEPPLSGKKSAILYSSNPLTPSEKSRLLIHVACALEGTYDVTIAADDAFSRCRVYSLCREFGLTLNSFRIRSIAEVDQHGVAIAISFGEKQLRDHIHGIHIAFERDGNRLLELFNM